MPFAPESLSLLDVAGFKEDSEGSSFAGSLVFVYSSGYLSIQDVPDKFLLSQAMKFLGLVLIQLS